MKNELMDSIGATWNSAYGHYELRLTDKRPALIINEDEAVLLTEKFKEYEQSLKDERVKQSQSLCGCFMCEHHREGYQFNANPESRF